MLTRRSSLLLPWLLAACGGGEERDFPPLHYNYLTPLRLNVATIQIEQRFVPSGAPPDVNQLDPMPPVQALRNMATDRLQALGAAGQGVFVILQASLIRTNNTITANFAVHRMRYETVDTYVGRYNYRLAYVGKELKIRERRAILDNEALRPHGKISFIL